MKTAFFMAHGAPTIYLEDNAYTRKLKQFKQDYPEIKKLLFFSAHNDKGGLSVANVSDYSTIHDFGGFPDELYQVRMQTKGDPQLAQALMGYLKSNNVPFAELRQAGIDHGVWTILKLIDPDNTLPVVNLSINSRENPKNYLELGQLLSDWVDEDTAIIFSGGLIHNLRALNWASDGIDVWAKSFDEAMTQALSEKDTQALLDITKHNAYRNAVPTSEHFIGIYLVYGTILRKGSSRRLSHLIQYGNLSLDYWEFTRD